MPGRVGWVPGGHTLLGASMNGRGECTNRGADCCHHARPYNGCPGETLQRSNRCRQMSTQVHSGSSTSSVVANTSLQSGHCTHLSNRHGQQRSLVPATPPRFSLWDQSQYTPFTVPETGQQGAQGHTRSQGIWQVGTRTPGFIHQSTTLG